MDLLVLVLVLVAAVAALAVGWWLLRRHEHPQEPASPSFDVCEVCSTPLDDRTAWRLYGEMHATVLDGVPAGSYVSADYCAEHAPEGATAPA